MTQRARLTQVQPVQRALKLICTLLGTALIRAECFQRAGIESQLPLQRVRSFLVPRPILIPQTIQQLLQIINPRQLTRCIRRSLEALQRFERLPLVFR